MIGIRLGLGIAGSQSAANRLRRYTVGGIAPSIVLDFEDQVYGADPDASLQLYASLDGTLPFLLFDFTAAEYGRQ